MQMALRLAQQFKGETSPNPAVGAIVVKNDKIIAQAAHQKAGEMHAEALALHKAGKKAAGADLYVTLEPCCHYGKTPPCTKTIIAAGIKRVFVAMQDPNPLVSGKGIAELRQHGIEVKIGLGKKEAEKLNEDFIYFQTTQKPFVTLKAAISLDGKIATSDYYSQWISNALSRKIVHKLRKEHDAILIGKNTFLHDDPSLNIRHIDTNKQPHKILLYPAFKFPVSKILNSKLYQTLADNKIFIVGKPEYSQKFFQYEKIEYIPTLQINGDLNLEEAIRKITEKSNIQSILIEGGSKVFTTFIQSGLVNKLQLFIAPIIIGNSGIPLFSQLPIKKIEEAQKLEKIQIEKVGDDILYTAYIKGVNNVYRHN